MPQAPGTLELIGRELARAFEPIAELLQPEMLIHLGIHLPQSVLQQQALVQGAQASKDIIEDIVPLIQEITDAIDAGDQNALVQAGSDLIQLLVDLIQSLKTLGQTLDGLGSSLSPAEAAELSAFAGDLAEKILHYTIVEYLNNKSASLAGSLALLGLIEDRDVPADPGQELSAPYRLREVRLDNLVPLLLDTENYFRDLYQWGDNNFDGSVLYETLSPFLTQLGVLNDLIPQGAQPPILEAYLFKLQANTSSPPGLDIRLRVPANFEYDQEFDLIPPWKAIVSTSGTFASGVEGTIYPSGEVEMTPPAGELSFEVGSSLVANYPDRPMIFIGTADGSRLEANTIRGGMGVVGVWNSATGKAEVSPTFSFALEDGKLFIDASQGDGFLNSILSGLNLESSFSLAGTWSSTNGLQLSGSAGIELYLPVHLSLGPVEFQGIYLIGVLGGDTPFRLDVATQIKANLGPLKTVVERMGVSVPIDFPPGGDGNLGPVDLGFAFKPPNGIGLSLDAGVIKGGGYLFLDFDREEYAGALELVFSEWIALKAIGLITTRMPDGSKGFSLLIIITVEFGTGLQLGFGFTLLGVGGILGLNRTVNMQPLTDGIRTGAIESVMFPQDVIANAPQIISDLRQFFPPFEDQFLVGPMAKIGWGTPLRLQVNFIGRFEPENSLLWFYAELFDSRILFITLEGGFGLLINWGDQANFVISAGGFHPAYPVPPLPFPEPPRIAVNLLNESYARVRIEGYFAVTSNSVQFGARVEVFFGLSEFNIDGHFGFDALFQFDPFYFHFSLSVSLSVKVFGIGLFSVGFSGLLEGPTPWHIKGKGKISLLLFDIKVPFEETWGENRNTELPPIEILPIVESEFQKLSNWQAVLPEGSHTLVSLRQLGESEEDALVLHPVGYLQISQQKVPLDFLLELLGNQEPSDVNRVFVSESGDWSKLGDVEQQFATGQFKKLDGSKKLSTPGFEWQKSGLKVSADGAQWQTSQAVVREVRYETIIIDNNYKRHVIRFYHFYRSGFSTLYSGLFQHFVKGAPVGKSALSQQYKKQFDPMADKIELTPNQYSVAFASDNKPFNNQTSQFTSQSGAEAFMQQRIQEDPNLADQLHVLPNTEVNF